MPDSIKDRFLMKAEALLSTIRQNLKGCELSSSEGPTPQQLVVVLYQIESMRDRIRKDEIASAQDHYRSLTRLVIDEWPLGSSLAREIVELEELYIKALGRA